MGFFLFQIEIKEVRWQKKYFQVLWFQYKIVAPRRHLEYKDRNKITVKTTSIQHKQEKGFHKIVR